MGIISQGPPRPLALERGAGRHQRGAEPRGLLGVARLRHGQGLRLPGRPGRDRDHVPRGARRDPPPRAPRRDLPPQRGGQARHPRLRRRLRRPHLLRGRHHRPGDPARALRAADEARRGGPLRGVVRHQPHPRRGRPRRRRRGAQHPRRLDGGLPGQDRDPRLGRQRAGLQPHHQRPDLHRRRHRDGLPARRPADGHGDGAVPPDHARGQRAADHRGRPRRGRSPLQRRGRALHGEVRAQQDGAGLARRRLSRGADRDQRGPRLPRRHRRAGHHRGAAQAHPRGAARDRERGPRLRRHGHHQRADPHQARQPLHDGRHQDRRQRPDRHPRALRRRRVRLRVGARRQPPRAPTRCSTP